MRKVVQPETLKEFKEAVNSIPDDWTYTIYGDTWGITHIRFFNPNDDKDIVEILQ